MADPFDRKLEEWLDYPEAPRPEAFVIDVMQAVRREQRMRQVILWAFGLVGGVFGLLGAIMLSDSFGRLLAVIRGLPAMGTMQVALFIVGAAAFYIWFMNDDWSTES
jgi:lipid-A-disaccharide synthase-like uncharacterized protein